MKRVYKVVTIKKKLFYVLLCCIYQEWMKGNEQFYYNMSGNNLKAGNADLQYKKTFQNPFPKKKKAIAF